MKRNNLPTIEILMEYPRNPNVLRNFLPDQYLERCRSIYVIYFNL